MTKESLISNLIKLLDMISTLNYNVATVGDLAFRMGIINQELDHIVKDLEDKEFVIAPKAPIPIDPNPITFPNNPLVTYDTHGTCAFNETHGTLS